MSQLLQSLVDALSAGATLGLAALAIGLVFGVIRLANFATGEIITAGAYTLIFTWQLGWYISIPFAIIVAVLLSLLMELSVFSRMRAATPATLLIASFGLSFLLQRVYELAFTNNVQTAPVASELAQSISIGGVRIQMLSVATILLAALLLTGLQLFLTRTSLGLQLKAAAADFKTARLIGIPASRVIGLSFALSGILAAAVAFVTTVQTGAVGPTFGVPITILALVGAVIGGIDKISGALAGGFLVGFATSMLASWLPQDMSNFKDAYVFMLVIGVLLMRPQGLLIRGRGAVRT
ncbi:MAG: branched-chain amino acid ABC transporter permease [Candidatus Nanopelagicales bacterium]|jgi:branched-chain amino acid transport system permease protein|nr:branched-chain amino acid ABC transporter permease [Candidatus Nanopelagicales bacterium]